jgi:hypothetical protein
VLYCRLLTTLLLAQLEERVDGRAVRQGDRGAVARVLAHLGGLPALDELPGARVVPEAAGARGDEVHRILRGAGRTGAEHHPLGCHRPRIPDGVVFEKLIQVLVFGCAYHRIADESCSATTLRDRRDEWIELGVIDELRQAALGAYDR